MRKFLEEPSQDKLSNKQVRYFAIDRTGLHCIILCSDAVFYANFKSTSLYEIYLKDPAEPANSQQSAGKFTSVEMV